MSPKGHENKNSTVVEIKKKRGTTTVHNKPNGKSDIYNVMDNINGSETASLLQNMLSKEISELTPLEQEVADEMFGAVGNAVDDFRLHCDGSLNLSDINRWICDIKGLLEERWVSIGTKNRLLMAYEEAIEVDVFNNLKKYVQRMLL